MAQIPINPFDNDRLKTRKVQGMLSELGVLPPAHPERPTFLKDHRAAAILIDRALSHLAPVPLLSRCSNLQNFSSSANLKFGSAFTPISGGGDAPPGSIAHFSFAQDSYWTEAAGTLTAAQVISSAASIEPGVGYTGEDGVGLIGPALAALQFGRTIVLRGRVIVDGPGGDTVGGIALLNGAEDDTYAVGYGVSVGVNYVADPQEVSINSGPGSNDAVNTISDSTPYITIPAASEARFDMAVTLTATKASASQLGEAVATTEGSVSVGTITVMDMPGTFALTLQGISIAYESITVYVEQLDADLPALSAPLV